MLEEKIQKAKEDIALVMAGIRCQWWSPKKKVCRVNWAPCEHGSPDKCNFCAPGYEDYT